MNAMVPDEEQDGSKTVPSWFYPKILLNLIKLAIFFKRNNGCSES